MPAVKWRHEVRAQVGRKLRRTDGRGGVEEWAEPETERSPSIRPAGAGETEKPETSARSAARRSLVGGDPRVPKNLDETVCVSVASVFQAED
jgi:hypothetical protein